MSITPPASPRERHLEDTYPDPETQSSMEDGMHDISEIFKRGMQTIIENQNAVQPTTPTTTIHVK